jgi:hypothetical protein
MKLMTVLLLALGPAAVQDPPQQDIPALIQKLGSDDFAEREKADQQLRDIGEPALPALREAAQSKDAEMAARARRLVDDITKAAERKKQEPRPGPGPGGFRRSFAMKMVTPEIDLSVGDDGVVLKEKSTGKTYEAESIEEFRKKYPEQAEKYLKGFSSGQAPQDPRRRWRERFKDPPGAERLPDWDELFKDLPGFGRMPDDLFKDLPPEFEEFHRRQREQWDRMRRRLLEEFGQTPPEFDPPQPPELPSGRAAARFGAQVGPVNDTIRQQLGLAEDEGVLVERVEPGSAAERAGLQTHDVIVAIDGQKVGNRWKLRQIIADRFRQGGELEVAIVRQAQRRTLKAKFDAAESEKPRPPKPKKTEDF